MIRGFTRLALLLGMATLVHGGERRHQCVAQLVQDNAAE